MTIIEGLQRVLQLLRRAVHARPRADAAEGRHPRRGPRGGGDRAAGRSSCSGRSSITTQAPDDPACDFAGLLEAVHDVAGRRADPVRQPAPAPRRRRGSSTRCAAAEGLPAPASAGAVRLDAGAGRRCAAGTRARAISTWSTRFARRLPDVALSTDMIVGFPGETDADFEETLSLTAAVRYHSMFSFKYSPRPNTLAEQAAAGRRAGGGEDAADRGAAGAAAGDSDGAARGSWSGATVDVLVDAASRRRDTELSGRTTRQRRREPAGPADVDRPDGAGARSSAPGRTASGAQARPA